MHQFSASTRAGLVASAVAAIATLVGLAGRQPALWQPSLCASCALTALVLRGIPPLRGYQFTAWIVAAFVAGMIFPQQVLHAGGLDMGNAAVILTVVQLVMFGMGAQMRLHDFAGVAKMPWSVLVGIACHFTIMPLVGFALTKVIPLSDEVAAGVILIGCCSAGLSSNVMAYIAHSNLALSITMTSITTALAPLLTPLWMKLLAGSRVPIDALAMMADIIRLVIVPIGAAMLHDYLKRASPAGRRVVLMLAAASAAWLAWLATGGYYGLSTRLTDAGRPWFNMLNYVPGAILFGVLFHQLALVMPAIERAMPVASMCGILYYTAIATAKGRDNLLAVGGLLFVAAAIHNALGYMFGYWLSRALRVKPNSARTVAFEVGLQNGGMASGIATSLGKLGTIGLAAAVFSPWMNITGSILANYWRRRPLPDDEVRAADAEAINALA